MLHCLTGLIAGVMTVVLTSTTTIAGNTDKIESMNAGAATVLESDVIATLKEEAVAGETESGSEAADQGDAKEETAPGAEEDEGNMQQSGLVMAKVNNALNIREEADEESAKAGMMYADCGGTILERANGWTKLKTGDLIGWAKDEYLAFGDEAEEMAAEVGTPIAEVEADALWVRKEPSKDADTYAIYAKNDILEVVEDLGEWISVVHEGEVGYVAAEYVTTEFKVDAGETMEVIKAREEEIKAKKEAERKAKLTENRGAVKVEAPDEILLAALIQCEAGNQPYEGQLGVGAVVMNRVKSPAYPNTVSGVIYASGQFTPALNGKVAKVVQSGNIKASCILAAQEAIAGATTVGGATHFRRAGYRDGIVIAGHVFW